SQFAVHTIFKIAGIMEKILRVYIIILAFCVVGLYSQTWTGGIYFLNFCVDNYNKIDKCLLTH
ncbi:MAG: hypothetical protein JSV97_04770, partial [candidate division WOR-3 bacterium]